MCRIPSDSDIRVGFRRRLSQRSVLKREPENCGKELSPVVRSSTKSPVLLLNSGITHVLNKRTKVLRIKQNAREASHSKEQMLYWGSIGIMETKMETTI